MRSKSVFVNTVQMPFFKCRSNAVFQMPFKCRFFSVFVAGRGRAGKDQQRYREGVLAAGAGEGEDSGVEGHPPGPPQRFPHPLRYQGGEREVALRSFLQRMWVQLHERFFKIIYYYYYLRLFIIIIIYKIIRHL